jgi:hypothetical protein
MLCSPRENPPLNSEEISSRELLQQRCSELHSDRELLEDHLESTIYELAGAREQLAFAREALAGRERNARDMDDNVANLKRGMVSQRKLKPDLSICVCAY